MPTLEWIGKNKVINHNQDVPFRVLERKYSFDENGQHNEDNGSENMIIRGDNLEALKALLPRYEGRVKFSLGRFEYKNYRLSHTEGCAEGLFFACNFFLSALKNQILMTEKQKMHTLITIVVSHNEQEELSL